jgi:hypothetical protein
MESYQMDTLVIHQIHENTILGFSQDSIVQAALTVLIFFLGYWSSKRLELWKKNRRLDDTMDFLLLQSRSLLAPIDRLIESLSKTSKELADEKHPDISFEEVSDLYLDPIRTIAGIDLFNAFRRGKKKIKDDRLSRMSEILKTVEFIRLQRERVPQWIDDYIDAYRRYQTRWNQSSDSILRQFDEFRVSARINNISPKDDTYLGELDLLIHNWSQVEDSKTYAKVKAHLLEPIRELCRKYKSDLRNTILLPLVLDALAAFDDIEHVAKLYSDLFDEQATKLRDRKAKFVETLNFFKTT